MSSFALTIITEEKAGVLEKITNIISKYDVNISYAHLFVEKTNLGTVNFELENVDDIDHLISELNMVSAIKEIEVHGSVSDIFGKRIVILGGGAQVSQVALGAISEADRHNIRGERISVDTIPLVGEDNIAEAVDAVSRLPRVNTLVLAGSLMGGKITKAVHEVKEKYGITVISLNMAGSVTEEADLIVSNPIQAGVMAVMDVSDTAVFDINKLNENNKF